MEVAPTPQRSRRSIPALVDEPYGEASPTITDGVITERPIDLGGGLEQSQWLIIENDGTDIWVLAETAGTLSLFRAQYMDLRIVPGAATINDAERVRSQASTVVEIAQMQQRLRYWNYPDVNGDLLVVDGIVGPLTRRAAGLFAASVGNTAFTEADFVSGEAFNYINSLNGPRWGVLAPGAGDHFEVVSGPFLPTSPPRYHGTDWIIDTVKGAATKVKTGNDPISMLVAVGALSAANGPGSNIYHHAGHDAGMSVDFLLPISLETNGNGDLSVAEVEVVRLVAALESEAYPGVTLKEVRTSNSDIAQAINQGRLTPIAFVDPSFAAGLHVEINPPQVSFVPPLPDAVVDDDVNNGLQELVEWLGKLVSVTPCTQFPALIEVGADPEDGACASNLASTIGLSQVLTGQGSILDELNGLLGSSSPAPDVLAEQLSKTQAQMYLNLPKSSTVPTGSPFNPSDPTTFNHAAPFKVFDSVGGEHDAIVYYIKTAVANQWRLRFSLAGNLAADTHYLTFSGQTDNLVAPSSGIITISDFQPTSEVEPIDLVFDYSTATQRNDQFRSGWTTWSVAAQGQFEKSTGLASLHLALNGRGSTGDRQLDLSRALSEIGVTIPHNIHAVAGLNGALDFTVTWDSDSAKPVAETITVQLHDFNASVDVLADTIELEAKAGLLAGRIVDSGPSGTTDSFIAASVTFDVDLNGGEPILVGQLDTLDVGEDYSVDIVCDLDGRLYFATTLGGIPIPGEFYVQLGLTGEGAPMATPGGDLDDVLDQLKNLSPKSLADTFQQLADWLSGMGNFGAFKDALPLGGGSFGKWADLGDELKQLLFNKFQEVQLVADAPPVSTLPFSDATAFELTVSDTLTVNVSVPASVTANNTTITHLAADLSSAIATALNATDFAGSLVATVEDGKLAISSKLPGIAGIRVANADGQTTPGVERLGFSNNQAVDQLRFETLQDLEELIREALGLDSSEFSLVYNRAVGLVTADINFISESLLGSETISLGRQFGGLGNIQSNSTIELWRRAEGSFGFGIELSPLGTGFHISDSTSLSSLPTWGMGIDPTKPADLSITLSDGSSFTVDLGTAQNIGDARALIAAASESGGIPRVSVVVNSSSNGLSVVDLTYEPGGDFDSRFKIAGANGSFAPLVLGILAEDDNDDGLIEGLPLHGESLANRLFLNDVQFDVLVQATAADIDATANFGIVNVGIRDGSGEASAQLSLALNDPDSDGRIYLSEMVDAGVLPVIGTPQLHCDLNLELPVFLDGTITGLSLPSTAAIIISWADIHNGTEPSIHLRDLDNIQGFENFTAFGLSLDLPIARAIDASLDALDGLDEIQVRLRGVTSPINLDLSYIDPTATGPALKFVQTFRDLADALRIQTGGKLTMNFSPDGRSLVLYDNTSGSGTFRISQLNGSILSQLGLSGLSAVDGKIEGQPIYQPSILDALRRVVDLLRSFEQLDGLSQPIPGTSVSINDLLDFADKLELTLNDLQNRPNTALQALELALESGLGIDGSDLAIRLDGDALKIVARISDGINKQLGLNFDLGDTLGQFVSLKSEGRVVAEVGAEFVLALGVDLADPEDLRPFLYTADAGTNLIDRGTRLGVTARISTPTPINMSAAIGPLGAYIVGGFVKLDRDGAGPSVDPASVTATVRDTNGDGRRYLDELSLSSLQLAYGGQFDASLPIHAPTNAPSDLIGPITLTANLQDPIGSFDVTLPDFSAALAGIDFDTDLSVFLDGWDGLLGLFQDKLVGKLNEIKLPVIGNQLGDLASFLLSLREEVGSISPSSLIGSGAILALQNQLFQTLTGIGVLREKDGASGISANDVLVTQGDTFVEFEVALGGTYSTGDLEFDLNLPGLGLELAEGLTLNLSANWQIHIGVGIDENSGVYVKLDPNKTDDLHLDFIASLTGGSLGADLGFLTLTVDNNRTEAAAEFDIDLDPGSDGRISLGEIFSVPFETSFSGNVLEGGVDNNKAAIIDWTLTASIAGEAALPQMRTGFDLNWTVNSFSDLARALRSISAMSSSTWVPS